MGYIFLTRCGLNADEYLRHEDFAPLLNFNTPETVNAIGVATRDIAEIGLAEISRTVRNLQRAGKNTNRTFAETAKARYAENTERTNQPERSAEHGTDIYQSGRYRLPNLAVPEQPQVHLGKYALLRRSYLKEHRRILFTNLLTSGKLTEHMMEIEEAAQNRMEQIVKGMAAQDGVTEELKARDQMEWVRRMNAIRDSAEEVIRRELIYN